MSSFGERLRHERVSRGMTIEQIASATGIGLDYLEALERSDFRALPGRAFGKLHIRAFAETLGFDPRGIIAQYDEEREAWQAASDAQAPAQPESGPRIRPPLARRPRTTVARPLALGIASVVILAVAAGVYGLFFRARAEAGVAERAADPASARVVPATPPSEPPVARPAPVVTKKAPLTREAAVLQADPAGPITIGEYGVGRKLENRRLTNEESRFRSGEAALFSTRVTGGRPGGVIRHVWLHQGRVQQTITLKLGGADWRTHSRKTLYLTGAWAVEARDEQGSVLARVELLCEPAGS